MKKFNFKKTKILKDIIRNPYVWPGGYERLIVTNDGGLICSKCCKSEFKNMLHSTLLSYRDGWQVESACYEAISPESTTEGYINTCCHCNKLVGELN